MPGVDLLAQLGAGAFLDLDATRLNHALQRARYDFMGVASRRAMEGDLAGGNAETKAVLDDAAQLRGWVVISPAYLEQSTELLRRLVGGGQWLGAYLDLSHKGASLVSPACRELINSYRRYGKPLMVPVHDETAVGQIEQLALEFNQMKLVAAGAGGDAWASAAYAAKRAVNLFLEPFSGGYHRGKLEAIQAIVGGHRLLFASNYPTGNPGAALGLLLDSGLPDAEKQAVFGGNAIRLFSLRNQAA